MDELIAFRVANFETPLWSLPNLQPGRYDHPGSAATQYLALHPLTPWAEVLRATGLATAEQSHALRLALWALRVEGEEPLELTYENARDWDLEPGDLVGDDQGPCQDLAQRLRNDPGLPGALTVPSAALPGTRNLVILDERVAVDYHLGADRRHRPAARARRCGRARCGPTLVARAPPGIR